MEKRAAGVVRFVVYVTSFAATFALLALVDRLGVPEGFLKFLLQAVLIVPMFVLLMKVALRFGGR
ncbi:MAG TPA: hypothetical protein VFL80_00615 [Thermoanaerobaculia bacterium]|nr:hypothetical protein [Thermoanaerobaculia bacterium]